MEYYQILMCTAIYEGVGLLKWGQANSNVWQET